LHLFLFSLLLVSLDEIHLMPLLVLVTIFVTRIWYSIRILMPRSLRVDGNNCCCFDLLCVLSFDSLVVSIYSSLLEPTYRLKSQRRKTTVTNR